MDKLILKLIRRFKTNDPYEIASGLNILVRYADLDESTRGFYYRTLRRRFIVLNNNLDEQWMRFVCAHELAHDRLHPGLSQFWLDEQSFYNPGKYERQANKFAVKLLSTGDCIKSGESIRDMLLRNNIPPQMDKFYF